MKVTTALSLCLLFAYTGMQALSMPTSPVKPQTKAQPAHQINSAQKVSKLVESLGAPTVAARVLALQELAKLGPAAEPAVPAILDLLGDNRSAASASSNSLSISPAITTASIQALTKIGPSARDASPYLVMMLTDRNELFRRAEILAALEAIGADSDATKAVIKVAGEEGKFTDTRHTAIRLLGKIEPPALNALEFLQTMADDQSDKVSRTEAITAINRIKSREKELVDNAKAGDESAANSGMLSQLGEDQDENVRLRALQEIADRGPKAVSFVPKLMQLVADQNRYVRRAALDALSSIGTHATPAIPTLLSQLLTQTNQDERQGICRTMADIDPQGKRIIPLVQPLLDDPFKARAAIELLDQLGTESSLAAAQNARKRWHMK